MTITPLEPMAPPSTRSEALRLEVRAEVARRGISQRMLAELLELSAQALSDRMRGRTPWSIDDTDDLERVLALEPGTLTLRAIRAMRKAPAIGEGLPAVRPEGFEPPTFWFGASPGRTSIPGGHGTRWELAA